MTRSNEFFYNYKDVIINKLTLLAKPFDYGMFPETNGCWMLFLLQNCINFLEMYCITLSDIILFSVPYCEYNTQAFKTIEP